MPMPGLFAGSLSDLRAAPDAAPDTGATAESLDALAAAYGAAARSLILLDREGAAWLLAGTLPAGADGPRILEALETETLWQQVREGCAYAAEDLVAPPPTWPADPQLVTRFFRRGGRPLGALLLERDDAATPAPLADRLASALLHAARLERESTGLRDFTRALIGAAGRGVLATDAQGRVTYLSAPGAEILGIAPAAAIGADCTRVLLPAVGDAHPLLEGLAGRLERIDLYVTDHRGRDLPLSLSLAPIRGAVAVEGLVCLFQDLTEQRTLDQDAQRRERLAVIGELAAGVAHEIRNPLTGIANGAQVLQMRLAENDSGRRMADLILRETQRLDRIVTSLLGFARPGPPHMQETQIEELTGALLEFEQAACESAGVRPELRVIGRIPAIWVDPEQIRQVLQNLVRNALQAMPQGGALTLQVMVVRRRLYKRGGMGRRASDRVAVPSEGPMSRFVRIRVQDGGEGIAADVLPRIFDPFFTTRSAGTGLGLSVSQSILQEHGGAISVQSVLGRGTIFDVDLPVERRQGDRREPGRRGEGPRPGSG
jgi:signal transduction histidine kinase